MRLSLVMCVSPQISSPDNCLLKHEGDLSFSFIIDLQTSVYIAWKLFFLKAVGAAVSAGLSVSLCDGFCCTDGLNCNKVKFLTLFAHAFNSLLEIF